ncbi:ATPase [Rhizoctonia solani]|uniref:ATPase n=1 Tax=Rhizoctonia solani TaxID=456999 RepID=A0A8H8T1B9_9AGAM|nr:ATPase [Rhizoctonia solani]QRW25209.1 ATPase [Rhizoctonia solani]
MLLHRRLSSRASDRLSPSLVNTAIRSANPQYKIRHFSQETAEKINPASENTSRALQPTDLLELYRGLVIRGDIKHDEEQVRTVMRLRRLSKALEGYIPNLISGHAVPAITPPGTSWWTPHHKLEEESSLRPSKESKALLRRVDIGKEMEDLPFPKGLILTAPPGRGKTFLLDLWFSSLPTKHKVRKHYSTLVLEMYRAVWEESQHRAKVAQAQRHLEAQTGMNRVKWSAELKQKWKSLFERGIWDQQPTVDTPAGTTTHISPLPISQILAARLLLRQGWLLHIDELQLLDIGSATILSDVLAHFWKMGGVVVATSNKVPGELYKNGLGAERVKGFIAALEARCDVFTVGGGLDWRREEDEDEIDGARASGEDKPKRNWFTRGQQADFNRIVGAILQDRQPVHTTLTIFSRSFTILKAYPPTVTSPPAAQFAFDELCNTALGTADYATLASTFPTLIITDIPILKLATKDRARRFISLIDALYEARVKIICMAEAEIDGTFFPEELRGEELEGRDNEQTMMEEALSEGNIVYRPNVSTYQPVDQDPPAERDNKKPSPRTSRKEGLSIKELSIFTGKFIRIYSSPPLPIYHVVLPGQEEKFAYSRATSRLVQMTSPKYAAQAIWQPLTRAQQPWHVDTPPSRPSDYNQIPTFATEDQVLEKDWAEEASYDARRSRRGRPEPPRLSENHAWGVRDDWGKGVGDWGKGKPRR